MFFSMITNILYLKATNLFLDHILAIVGHSVAKEIEPFPLPDAKYGFSKKILFATGGFCFSFLVFCTW